jgi:hypothetical protein
MKSLKTVVRPQIGALRNSAANDSERSLAPKANETDQRAQLAVLHAQALIGGFRKCEADDPAIYFRVIENTLARYDVEIQREVADTAKWKYPPTAFELRQACEALANEKARAEERDERIAQQLAELRADRAERAERKPLAYQVRGTPPRITREEQERCEARQILDRYENEAAPCVFKLDPTNWNA